MRKGKDCKMATVAPYIHEDWLLHTPAAVELYHRYAENEPIIDYHCHLPPAEIAGDKRWSNLAEVWLGGDHYKWRGMRSDGVDERLVTGDSTWREKFDAYAACMPHFLGNPLFDWSHLELVRYFGIDDILSPETAASIWDRAAERLADPSFSARGLMVQSRVRCVCTTDDPCDDLAHHRRVREEKGFSVKVLPAWRPDKGFKIENTGAWNAWVDRLAAAAGRDVATFADFIDALGVRAREIPGDGVHPQGAHAGHACQPEFLQLAGDVFALGVVLRPVGGHFNAVSVRHPVSFQTWLS